MGKRYGENSGIGESPDPIKVAESFETTFHKELETLINKYCMESRSNTPDFILAQYLSACLLAFDTAVQRRETWYGRDARPSYDTKNKLYGTRVRS